MEDETKITRWVVCSALLFTDGRIVCGPRHPHAMWLAAGAIIEDNQPIIETMTDRARVSNDDYEQGFVDQFMVYMSREEAWIVANENGQIRRHFPCADGMLFSEHLY